MEREKLLSTDQSSSEVKVTTTGHSTPSGDTRTKATQALISHFMFLAEGSTGTYKILSCLA